jgi:uncharacterized phosphosugar-binding protein
MTGTGIERYFDKIIDLQQQVIESQRDLLTSVASRMADAIENGGRIFVFGSGHSHMLMEEGFYRAGGLAAVVPIFSSALMLHENADLCSQLERTPGLSRLLLNKYGPKPGEVILVYSNSGVNILPVEMALTAREMGLAVVSVCSKEYAKIAPLSSLGKRLFEVSDYAIDNCGVPGDAVIPIEGVGWKVSSSSTITNSLIWNCLLTETVLLLKEKGVDLPVFISLNLKGAAEHNQVILEKWRKVNPYL